MKHLITAAIVAATLSACTANAPAAPVVSDNKDHAKLSSLIGDGAALPSTPDPAAPLIGPAASGPAVTSQADGPLFGSAVSDSCDARQDRTPCILTNQQAFIEIFRMSMDNVQCSRYAEPKTWEDLMLPPVPANDPDCLPGGFRK